MALGRDTSDKPAGVSKLSLLNKRLLKHPQSPDYHQRSNGFFRVSCTTFPPNFVRFGCLVFASRNPVNEQIN